MRRAELTEWARAFGVLLMIVATVAFLVTVGLATIQLPR